MSGATSSAASSVALAMRRAIVARCSAVETQANRLFDLPTDPEIAQLRQAMLSLGYVLSWSIGQAAGVVWYAKRSGDQCPLRIGDLAAVFLFLDGLGQQCEAPPTPPHNIRAKPAKRKRKDRAPGAARRRAAAAAGR